MLRLLYLCLIFTSGSLVAQDFMMQGWYWDYPSDNCGGVNTKWAVNLQTKATTVGNAGFTFMWLPPAAKGGSECSVGYDPKDLYDLGDHGATRLGTRAQLASLQTALNNAGVASVADVVYNHRDGGDFEDNPAVRNYIMNYPSAAGTCNNGATPYPVNGKVRWRLPIGGSTGNTSGNYFFKFSSSSAGSGFYDRGYKVYFQTSVVGWQDLSDQNEVEPNGGGDCGTPNDQTIIALGRNMLCSIDNVGSGECGVDEFQLSLQASDYNPAGDFIEIYVEQVGGDGTGIDIRPYGLYAAPRNANIIDELALQTRTDFTNLPSGLGDMNYLNFKPNGTDPTCLEGDWDFPFFFFDVEQRQSSTQDVYNEWTKWLLTNGGFAGGLRMDAVKHFDPSMVTDLLNYLSGEGLEPEMIVGEIFDTNTGALNGWVNSVNSGLTADVDVRAFDFNLRSALKDACDQYYFNFNYDTRNVYNAGMVAAGASAFSVVTFLNNHDYRGENEPVQADPMLGYAYLLTNNKIGLPCVFYPDFFGDDVPFYPVVNLESEITDLMALHQSYIFGADRHDYLNAFSTGYASNYNSGSADKALIYQISGGFGGKDVIVAINFGNTRLQVDHQINTSTAPIGTEFTDEIGNSAFSTAVVSASSPNGVPSSVYIDLPARSYSVWVEGGSVLPAELIEFTAQKAGRVVKLDWRTAQEENVKHFRVERSVDGRVFYPLGEVKATGNTTTEQAYQLLDQALPIADRLYYRLATIDHDASEQLSFIRQVNLATSQPQVWPNPLQSSLNLSPDQAVGQLTIFDADGQLVAKAEWNTQAILTIDTQQWANGVYQVVLQDEFGEVYWVKQVVKS